jgi:hypothetical protein
MRWIGGSLQATFWKASALPLSDGDIYGAQRSGEPRFPSADTPARQTVSPFPPGISKPHDKLTDKARQTVADPYGLTLIAALA